MKRADPRLTPGAWGMGVTPRHVSLKTKLAVYRAYKIPALRMVLYTIDHLIPLELDGTNEQTNLWPQPRREAKVKDQSENSLAAAVRRGDITVAQAQASMLASWRG